MELNQLDRIQNAKDGLKVKRYLFGMRKKEQTSDYDTLDFHEPKIKYKNLCLNI